MLASETRQHAREALQGKWGKAALTMLVYGLITWVISFVLRFIPVVGQIIELVIEIPLTYGLLATLIKLKRGEDTTYIEFFTTGFNNFASSWKVALWTCVKLLAPLIVMIVSIILIAVGISMAALSIINSSSAGIGSALIVIGYIAFIASAIWGTIKGYLYKPVFMLLFDNPDKPAKEIVEESAKVMKGNRWKWFCLELSFIGWMILACITFGIGMLWLTPYMLIATVVFYEFLFGKKDEAVETVSEEPAQEVIEEPKGE